MAEKRKVEIKRGLFFEEFEVGQFFVTAGRTLTEADIVGFAGLTGDWTQIHTDIVYAGQHPFGQRVAHGMLGLSIASGLAMRLGLFDETILAFREIREWKFSLPMYIGDTVHLQATVSETRAVRRMGGGLVTFQVEMINQNDQVIQHGGWVCLVKSDPSVEEKTGTGL